MQESTSFISSNLSDGTYDDEAREMTITFSRGDEYTYYDVPPEVWQALKFTASPGRFLRDNVIGRF